MNNPREKGDSDPTKPSPARIAIWIGVGGVGLYFLVSGIVGIVSNR